MGFYISIAVFFAFLEILGLLIIFHILPGANAGNVFKPSGKIGIIGITATLGDVRKGDVIFINFDKVAGMIDSDFR